MNAHAQPNTPTYDFHIWQNILAKNSHVELRAQVAYDTTNGCRVYDVMSRRANSVAKFDIAINVL